MKHCCQILHSAELILKVHSTHIADNIRAFDCAIVDKWNVGVRENTSFGAVKRAVFGVT
jgi:hypothetical protein